MKVVLVVPANAPGAYRLEQKLPFAIENLAVGYLAAHLSARGLDWRIIDGYAHALSCDELVAKIEEILAEDDVLAFTVLQSTVEEVNYLVRAVRHSGFGGAIVLGGWAATMTTRELMNYIPGANYALVGECEAIFPDFVEALRRGSSIAGLPNVVWREDCAIHYGTAAAEPLAFTHPSFPSTTVTILLRKSRSHAPHCLSKGVADAFGEDALSVQQLRDMEAKRGGFGTSESLLAELASVRLEGAQSRIFFVDDEFFGPTEAGFRRAREFAQDVQTAGLRIEFGFDCLLTDFDPGLFSLLQRAGLRKVFIGIDAGTSAGLKTFKKPYPVERIVPTLAKICALGIEAIFGFILFEPYMTMSDVRQNFYFLAQDLDYVGDPGKYLSKLDPEYGTELWARLSRDGLLSGRFPNWGFQFQDLKVASLYRQLEGPILELQARYRAAAEDDRAALGQLVREEVLTCFEREYRACGAKSMIWGRSRTEHTDGQSLVAGISGAAIPKTFR